LVTWIIICAFAVVLIGALSMRMLRPGGTLHLNAGSSRRFTQPVRLLCSIGCFVVLVAIMLNSTAGSGVRVIVIAIGAMVCIVQYLVLEAIYGRPGSGG
jgi:hypothetical protein